MNHTTHTAAEGIDTIKQLADAVSMQARVANRLWLATIIATLLIVLPRSSSPDSSSADLSLPFALGDVAPTAFYPAAFALLSILVVAFSSAHAQQARANELAHRAVERLRAAAVRPPEPISVGEFFDMLRMPSANRVAPLAQFIRGRYQFHDQAAQCPPWLRIGSSIYYVALKTVASVVYYVLPAVGLWYAFERTRAVALPVPLFWSLVLVGAIAAMALFQILLADVAYVYKVAVKILGRRDPAT